MTFVVEDGTGLSAANSYLSLTGADSFFADRNDSRWLEADSDSQQAALIAASQYLDVSFVWKGRRCSQSQGLDWPRKEVLDDENFHLPSNVLPGRLLAATAYLAREALCSDLLPSMDRGGAVLAERIRVDQVEEETRFEPGAPNGRRFPLIERLLQGLVLAGDSATSHALQRT